MRPRERRETGERIDQIIDMNHALVKLARTIDWRLRPSRPEEFGEMVVDAVGRFDLHGVAGRERLGIDKVAGVSAPDGRVFLCWRRASRSP